MRRIVGLAGVLWLLAGGLAGAEEPPQIIMKTLNVISHFPPPPWSTAKDLFDTSEIAQQQGKTPNGTSAHIFEMIPKGESFEDWRNLYAIFAERPLTGDIDSIMNGQINLFARACTSAALAFEKKLSDQARLFVIYCDAYKDRPVLGEVAAFRMELQGDTLVKLYQHVRVPAFSFDTVRDRPPVAVDSLRSMIVRVGNLRLGKPLE